MHDDHARCLAAVRSRDARFDGWFFTAVTTTGIYCRPSCPAATPRPENVVFHPSAASAQRAGFRACKRCRPDATPGSPEWDHRADLVGRAMRLIADGVVDRDGVSGLARQLGYSVRQVERHLVAELGAGPQALARAQRAQTARTLIETTTLPMGEVAFAAGFASVRSFNDTVRAVFATTPGELRTRAARRAAPATAGVIELRLPFRSPLHVDQLLGHLVATAIPGVEEWSEGAYRRTLRLPHGHGSAALRPRPDHVSCELRLTDLRDLTAAVDRCRRLLDLDADPTAVDAHLGADPTLGALVAEVPGRRVPRTVDGAELAIRAVLGQQVSTAAARTTTRRLVLAHGEAISTPVGTLTHLFPSPEALAALDPTTLPMPGARRQAVTTLAAALAGGDVDLGPGADRGRVRSQLAALPGIGPWTVETIAMRALGDPDAFLATDLGVRSAASRLGLPTGDRALTAYAERWRPWRAYAVQHLWGVGEHQINRLPGSEPAA
jgi:AraC family transcriptional regulator, regulatory protein of adaptative response / DNA-3-methyladenine glycosylase II